MQSFDYSTFGKMNLKLIINLFGSEVYLTWYSSDKHYL